MFLHFGNSYINTSQIKKIRPLPKKERGDWAEIEMIDGTTLEGFLTLEKIESLCMHILPAPRGHTTIAVGGEPNELLREDVIAFAFDPGWDRLLPITVQSGLLEDANVKCPNGIIYGPHEHFGSEREFLEEQAKKNGAKAA